MNNGTCLVTGATGAVGPSVVKELAKGGFTVKVFSADPPTSGLFPDGVEFIQGDILDRSGLYKACAGAGTVIHMAALLHIVNPAPSLIDEYRRVNVDGTKAVLAVAADSGVRRVVFFSTICVYGNSGGEVLDERSECRPVTAYGATKLEAENLVLKAVAPGGGALAVSLRMGAIYGPRIKGNYRKLLTSLASHRFIPIGRGENRRTLIFEHDAARAALLAAVHPDAAGKVYNVSDGQFHTLRDIIGNMCAALGRKPPRFSLPPEPVRFATRCSGLTAGILGLKPPISVDSVDKYLEDIAVDSSLIERELGFEPEFALRTGWQATVEEMRAHGEF